MRWTSLPALAACLAVACADPGTDDSDESGSEGTSDGEETGDGGGDGGEVFGGWPVILAGENFDWGYATAVDPDQNPHFAGFGGGLTDFGGAPISGGGGVGEFAPDGMVQWAADGAGHVDAREDLVVGASHAYHVSNWESVESRWTSLDIYDPTDGALQAWLIVESEDDVELQGIDLLGEDAVTTGRFITSATIGTEMLSGDGSNLVAVRIDPTGNVVWAKTWGEDAAYKTGLDVATTADAIFVVGAYSGVVDFGGELHDGGGSTDVFVMRLDPDGNVEWARTWGSEDANNQAMAADIGADGNLYVTGLFGGRIDFGDGEHDGGQGNRHTFLLSMSPDGDLDWSRTFDSNALQEVRDLACDGLGRVHLVGEFEGTLEIGAATAESAGGKDIYVVTYGGDGKLIRIRSFGGMDSERPARISASDDGHTYLAGSVWGSYDLGTGPMETVGQNDGFFLGLTP